MDIILSKQYKKVNISQLNTTTNHEKSGELLKSSSEAALSLPLAVRVLWWGLLLCRQPAMKFSCCLEPKQFLLPAPSGEVPAAHCHPTSMPS